MPQISQSFTVAYPRAQVWPVLGDIERVVPCMPGASLTAPVEGDAFAGAMGVKLGPIAASFAGRGELAMDAASHSGTLQGQGTDAKSNSRAKGTVTFTVLEVDGGAATRVDLAVDFTLGGALAQFGRGAIVQDIARRLTAEFARNLEATLAADTADTTAPAPSADATAGTPEGTPDGGAAAPPPRPAPAPAGQLNAGALLWAMLRDWIKGLLPGKRRSGSA